MTSMLRDRRGASAGDVLVFLATLGIAAALLYPAWSVRDFRARVETAVEDVAALGAAAREVRDATNRWPTSASPGEAPPELAHMDGAGGTFDRLGYAVGWTAWSVVDSVEAPPSTDIASPDDAPQLDDGPDLLPVVRTVGAITVHSAEPQLLAELLERFDESTSFVLDTVWLLVLQERGSPESGDAFDR